MNGPMRLLAVTWDGAGNLPPILALVAALVRRGHLVHVLGHDAQRDGIESAGGRFLGFERAAQIDCSRSQPLGDNPLARLLQLDQDIAADSMAACGRLSPDALLVDAMLPQSLRSAKRSGHPTVALVHTLYGFLVECGGGVFRAPVDAADLALGFTYAALDDAAAAARNHVFVGPARPSSAPGDWVRRWPDRPLVVASLSTGLQGKPGTQHALLQRVCNALGALDVEALVTTGRGIAPQDVAASPLTSVERFAPHERVLPHADVFITHAGHGSVAAGLSAGVPLLCLPPGGDQPFNAARVARLGLGEMLDPASHASQIGAALERLLADQPMRQRVREFAVAAAAHPGIELAVERIEAAALVRAP